MNQKSIIISLAIFFLASFFSLALIEKKQHQIENQWFLYFQNPNDSGLNFVIENYKETEDFKWQLLRNDDILSQGDVSFDKNESKLIIPLLTQDLNPEGKYVILVTQGNNRKNIYKILE